MSGPSGRRETYVVDGIAYVLPMHEGGPRFVRKIGRFGFGISWRWTSFNVGVDVLKAGVLVAIGPFYFWLAHIERQLAAWDALPTPAQTASGVEG